MEIYVRVIASWLSEVSISFLEAVETFFLSFYNIFLELPDC